MRRDFYEVQRRQRRRSLLLFGALVLFYTLEEIRIAAGAPRVAAYVLPTSAINSMGLVEADGTPAVGGGSLRCR